VGNQSVASPYKKATRVLWKRRLCLLCTSPIRRLRHSPEITHQAGVMRFSQRTGWNTEESNLARAHRRRVEAGLPIADLTASNPTRCGFVFPPDLLDALTMSEVLNYDPQPRGLLASREAVCAYYKDHGVTLDPEQIVLTTST